MGRSARMWALCLAFFTAVNGAASGAEEEFRPADRLVCTIEASTQPAEIGKKIRLTGLTTGAPQVIYENHVRASMLKLFESDTIAVIQLVAAVSGSVDTIVIDRTGGRFAHIAAGAFFDVHAIAETGRCRPE